MEPSTVAIVTEVSAFAERARTALLLDPGAPVQRWKEEYGRIDPAKVVADLVEGDASVVLLGPGLADESALDLAEAFDRDHPEVAVILVAEDTPSLWVRALRAGVRDVLTPDADGQAIVRSVHRAIATVERRRSNVVGDALHDGPARRVISVLSPKGGAGKTTVTTNVATALAQQFAGQVAVVDLDLQFGDVAAALAINPEHTMVDVARAPATLDATLVKVFLSTHASGLYALCAPETPAESDEITHEHATTVLRLLGDSFPFVVVDTAAGLDEHTLAAIEVSTDLVFVCSMDVASVRSLRKELDALDALGLATARRHFVLNRADARVGLSADDVEAAIGMAVDAAIPSTRAVPLSMNAGVPLVVDEPRSPVVRQLRHLVARLGGEPAVENADGGLLRRRRDGR